MLQKLVNEAYFTLRITTEGPLLVKSGHASVSGPDMTPVLTWRNGQQEVFLPGSSLKGVFRSHIEKVVCSLKPRVVCYPFEGNERRQAGLDQRRRDYRDSCGGMFRQFAGQNNENRRRLDEQTDRVYAASCPTCRLFGSTAFIGRVAIGDAYLASKEVKEQRDGVGIDRLTGGASHGAKFELEVVSTGVTFETDIHLRNFELWQLGMLFVILQDMEDQLIHIGSGRARGLGKVSAAIREHAPDDEEAGGRSAPGRPEGLVISALRASEEPEHELWGLGRWLNNSSYGTEPGDLLKLNEDKHLSEVKRVDRGIRSQRAFSGPALMALRDKATDQFVSRMQAWPARPDVFSLD
jgi:CRISPR-associated RAMP protein (TIGR02581 family)